MPYDRLDRVLASSPEVGAYERFLEKEARDRDAARDYLFLDKKPRFEPRREDVVVPLPGLAVRERSGAVRLVGERPPADVAVPGVSRRDVERVLCAFDGEKTLAEIAWEVDAGALAKVLRAGFGLVLFAPLALAALEDRMRSAEIVRFPSSPYTVERSYWQNMADVRERFLTAEEALRDHDNFVRLLRTLHVVALMGEGLDRFYKPASPASDGGADPGSFWRATTRVLETPRGVVYLDGPRVAAPPVGGERFFRMLCASLGDPEGAAAVRDSPWGTRRLARGERDAAPKVWFFPPRPVDESKLEVLRGELGAAMAHADAGRAEDAARAAGRFHYRFVRLHPFRCANQSVAMNIVNAVLVRAGGSGIPHLALDHVALRTTEAAYEEAFLRAARAFRMDDGPPAARLAEVARRSQAALSLMDAASSARDDEAAEAARQAAPDAARWALLEPT